ncbi:MAG: hypothetical protein JSU03_08425 [Bacteroidetes bacterium]|nr:hypothetical protein [Bacteroidota bacterium]
MKKLKEFSKNFFLANGVLWFLCSLSIIIFNLHFDVKEIIMTLILPLAYAIVKLYDVSKKTE